MFKEKCNIDIDEKEANTIFNSMDFNGSGFIDYTGEFEASLSIS